MMKKIVISMLFAVSAIILVSGCSSDSTPAPSTLTGTAATGAPIDGTVTVKDAKGVEKDVVTGSGGSFTLEVAGMTPPYLLKIMPSDGTATLYSYATQNGQTVNLTPTTNLAIFLAAGKTDLDAMYGAWDGTAVTEAAVDAAEATVRANLEAQIVAQGVDAASLNLFTTPFTADSTGIDAVMDDLRVTVDAVAGTYTFTDAAGVDMIFDENIAPIAPPAPAGAIVITTVTGGTHTLNSAYSTACYFDYPDGPDGRVDTVSIAGSVWINSSFIFTGDNTCSGTPSSTGAITATITKGADKQISGWKKGPGVAPDRADGNGQLSDTETVTAFTLSNISVADPDGAFGGFTTPAPSTTFTGFYVFDDTAAGFVMYRDDDGDFASVTDPFIRR